MTAIDTARHAGHRHPDAPQGGPARCSPARPASPTTSSSPARCTWPSCAARTPTPASRGIDVSDALGAARRRRRLHRRRPAPTCGPRPMPCAWPVTEDMKNPPHYPVAVDKACYVGDGVAVGAGRPDARGRATRSTPSIVDYDPLAGGRRPRGRAEPTGCVIHDDARHQHDLHVGARDRRATRSTPAFADAAHIVKERYVQQRLIPMAMEPRAVAAVPQPFGGEHHALLGHPDPPHPQGHGGRSPSASPSTSSGSSPRRSAAASARSSTSTPRSCSAWRSPASTACRCAGPRSAPRTPRPPSRAAARSRTSSWPPTPTASSPPSG